MKQQGKATYQHIADELRIRIARENLQPGDRLPALTEIARQTGVSIRTADQALQCLIRSGVCYRRPKQGTYVAVRLGSAGGKQRAVVLHSSWTRLEYRNSAMLMSFLDGAQAAAAGHGVRLIPVYDTPSSPSDFNPDSNDFEIIGVIFSDENGISGKIDQVARQSHLRFAWLNYWEPALDRSWPNFLEVLSDEAGGGAWSARYLWQLGHRNICLVNMISDASDMNYRLRLQGFEDEFQRLGGTPETLSHVSVRAEEVGAVHPTRRMLHGGQLALDRARRSTNRFSAVFCVEDALAAGIALADPSLEVVGYDRIVPLFAELAKITTIAVNYRQMAYSAVDRICHDPFVADRIVIPVIPNPKEEHIGHVLLQP